MKILVVASGSAGNAALFEAAGTRILVDAGVGPRVLARAIAEAGFGGPPDAIVVTHAHEDHLGHGQKLARKLDIPLWVTEATAKVTRLVEAPRVRVYGAREPFAIGALTIAPLPLPHDAAQVSLVVEGGGLRAGIATDLGEVPAGLAEHVAGCDVLLLESNHDAELLARGPYPAHLKRRIASARGHLSNAQAHALLRGLSPRTHAVVLMHLSQTNNDERLALEVAADALGERPVRLFAARQSGPLLVDAAATPPPAPRGRGKGGAAEQLRLF
jgi:phosphoribosyl 1,2-cyclic phosphodiesterase